MCACVSESRGSVFMRWNEVVLTDGRRMDERVRQAARASESEHG